MASVSERRVLKLVISELESVPVRGVYRGQLERAIEVLVEMSQYKAFEGGAYKSMQDIMNTVKFQRAKRAKVKSTKRGRPPLVDPGLQPSSPKRIDEGPNRGLTQAQVNTNRELRKRGRPIKRRKAKAGLDRVLDRMVEGGDDL